MVHSNVWWDEDNNLLTRDQFGRESYVMVQFERPLMEKVAGIICRRGGHVLNVGYGCGLVDHAIQSHDIESHTIVEAHPRVYRRMLDEGWNRRSNVTILYSRWQDVDWAAYHGWFDGIFWDPYPFKPKSFNYWAWHRLVHRLVRPGGKFVNYEICGTREQAESCGAGWPPNIGLEIETCEVEVPFEIPEWRGLGVGRHEIYIPVHTKVIRPLPKRPPMWRWNGRRRWGKLA
jgi:hypothetical protein